MGGRGPDKTSRVEELVGSECVLDVELAKFDLAEDCFALCHPNAGEPWQDLPPGTSGSRGEA